MKHWMTSLALALLAATMGSSASAATYYLSDCKAGAAQGCVPGSAANDGLSAATPKQLWSQLPARKGGDRILFAKGGSWTDASMGIYVATASPSMPVVWDSYSPPWGGAAKPILTEARALRYLFNFDDAGQKFADGGYVIRNLDLRGGGVMGVSTGGQAAVFTYWAVNDLLMENLEISGFKLGVYTAHLPKDLVKGWENYRITLRNSYVHDNSVASFLGGAADLVIENNILDYNGSTPIFDHDIYLSSAARAIIRGNTITRSVLDGLGKCTGSVIVVHGAVDGLLIENNKIVQPPGSKPTCYGIEISGGYTDDKGPEYFHDVVIRGNTVVDVGYIGIGARGCTRCAIEDNAVVWTAAGGNQGISMSVNAPSLSDERGTALVIRNNSIYMPSPLGTPTGILLVNEGAGHTVASNVIYYGAGATAQARCFDTKDYTRNGFAVFDNNLCFRAGGPLTYSPAYATLAAAQAAGFDLHGLNVDPQFLAPPSAANGYSLAVSPTSPAASLGVNARLDRLPPAAPTGLTVQ
jgi:hypothetical protein